MKRQARYNPLLTCINIRAKHVEEACKEASGLIFLNTKNSQILYFALVYQRWEVFSCDDLPNGPDLSCLFDFDLQAWIVMARSSHHHYHSGK